MSSLPNGYEIHDLLENARIHAGMPIGSLWTDFVALGGTVALGRFMGYFDGSEVPSRHDYDCIAHSLNEHFQASGLNHPIPYADELRL